MKKNNKGLEKLGESFMTLANLILVLFLFNTYIQKDNYNIGIVLIDIYGILILYYYGYLLINKAQKEETM